MNFLLLFLLFCQYFVDYGTAEHEKYIRTIHGYEDPPPGKTFVIDIGDEKADYHHVDKRSPVSSSTNYGTIIPKVKQQVFCFIILFCGN